MVSRFKKLIERGCWASLMCGGVPVAEAVIQETPRGCRYWSILPAANRNYLEKSGYYDELWSAVSVACNPVEDSKPMSFCTAERKATGSDNPNPKLLGIACDLVAKQLHRRQEDEQSPTSTKDNLRFPRPNGSGPFVLEAVARSESTPDVFMEGNGSPFRTESSAKNIPGRFLANPSVLVPNNLMIFNESKLDLDMQQSISQGSNAVIHVGTEMSGSTGLKTELPTTESLSLEHNDNIMQSSCSIEIGDCIDQENRIINSFYRDTIAVSATMDSEVSGRSELLQTLTDGINHDGCLTPSSCTIFEASGIFQEQEFIDLHNTSSTVLSGCGSDREPENCVAVPLSDGIELSSAAAFNSDAVAASVDCLHCKSSVRKERICLRDFRAFSMDVAEAPPTCSSKDPKMTSIINGQSRLKDDMIHQLSIQSGSSGFAEGDHSGFAEGDQLDASFISINDAIAPFDKLLNMERHRLKESSFSQCSAYSRCESTDFMDSENSECTQQLFSEGSDDCFHIFSEPNYRVPQYTAYTQTDSSFLPQRCFSAQNSSRGVATHHGYQQHLLNNGASSKVEMKTTAELDNRYVFISNGSSVSSDCVMSSGNASKQFRTEVMILVNQSSTKLPSSETSRLTAQPSAYDLKKLHEDDVFYSVETDALDPRKNINQTSKSFRIDQSSLVRDFGRSKSTVDSLYKHQSESVISYPSPPVRYRSNSVSFQPRVSARERNQTGSLKDSFDPEESYNWSGRGQSSPSSHSSGITSVICKRYEERFLDVSEHQMLQDQLKNSGFVDAQSLPSFTQSYNCPTMPISSAPKWKQCVRDELKLMDFAMRKYKLQNKLLQRRMCKAIDINGYNRQPSNLPQNDRDDLDMLEILHTEIMEELDKVEELLMQRLRRFLRSHSYEDEDEHLPLSDLTSQCILHSMNRLLHEQDYQSNIVNSINCTSDHSLNCSAPLASSPPPANLLLHSVPIVSIEQLSQCLASVEMLLSEMQKKTDVMEPFKQPVQKVRDQNTELKRRKSYRRFLPACLKPQWPKKQPVFKQQMSLPNIKDDH